MLFWWIFAIAWIVCLLAILLMQGFAQSRASGQGDPLRWLPTLGWSGGAALLFALVAMGVIALFS